MGILATAKSNLYLSFVPLFQTRLQSTAKADDNRKAHLNVADTTLTPAASSASHCPTVTFAGSGASLFFFALSAAAAGFLETATTFAPRSANCLTTAKPIPEVPPKTMAFLPKSLVAMLLEKLILFFGVVVVVDGTRLCDCNEVKERKKKDKEKCRHSALKW